MNTLLWEFLKDVTHWGQTQKPARTDEVYCINGIRSQGCWAGTKCLFSPDFIYEWFIDWLDDWLANWLTRDVSLQMCAQMMQVIGIRGQMLQYVIQLFCRWGLQCQYHWWNWLNASFWRGSAERALATVDKFSVQMSCAVVFVSSVLTFVRSHWKAVH